MTTVTAARGSFFTAFTCEREGTPNRLQRARRELLLARPNNFETRRDTRATLEDRRDTIAAVCYQLVFSVASVLPLDTVVGTTSARNSGKSLARPSVFWRQRLVSRKTA